MRLQWAVHLNQMKTPKVLCCGLRPRHHLQVNTQSACHSFLRSEKYIQHKGCHRSLEQITLAYSTHREKKRVINNRQRREGTYISKWRTNGLKLSDRDTDSNFAPLFTSVRNLREANKSGEATLLRLEQTSLTDLRSSRAMPSKVACSISKGSESMDTCGDMFAEPSGQV